MAQLPPDGKWLIQQIDGLVHIVHSGSGDTLLKFSVEPDHVAQGQKAIYDLTELTDEQKVFAHFWSGYFYACMRSMSDISGISDWPGGRE